MPTKEGPSALIAGAFGELPEILAGELRAIGVRPAFVERLPVSDGAESLFFYCGVDAGERLAPRLAAAEKHSGKVKRIFLIRANPATAAGRAAEHALRMICSKSGASLSIVSSDESLTAEFISRLAELVRGAPAPKASSGPDRGIDRLRARLLALIRYFTGLSPAS